MLILQQHREGHLVGTHFAFSVFAASALIAVAFSAILSAKPFIDLHAGISPVGWLLLGTWLLAVCGVVMAMVLSA